MSSQMPVINVVNQFDAAQRDGIEKSLEVNYFAFVEHIDKHMVEVGSQVDRRFAEIITNLDKRFDDLDVKMSQMQATLIRWMFTFFVGTVVTLATLFFSYIQLLIK